MILIDGDIIAFKGACATEYRTYHFDGYVFRYKADVQAFINANYDDEDVENAIIEPVTVTEPPENTEFAIKSIINKIVNNCGGLPYKIFLADENSSNFRKMVDYPVKYKGNRAPKPSNYPVALRYLRSLPQTEVFSEYEVDDALGMNQTESTIIASIDKDLLMIPGNHYHIDKEKIISVSRLDGLRAFYKQMLMGDRVDNIIGIDNIGPVTASKMIDHLEKEDDMKKVVKEAYDKFFGDTSDQMYQANRVLLWILRNE